MTYCLANRSCYENAAIFLKLFKYLPRLCETSQTRRSFSVTATQAFDAVAFPWRSKRTRRSCSVKGTSIRCCSVAMAFFVIPDTPYVWRVKRCHGIHMYLRRTFLIHSGSDAIECHFTRDDPKVLIAAL